MYKVKKTYMNLGKGHGRSFLGYGVYQGKDLYQGGADILGGSSELPIFPTREAADILKTKLEALAARAAVTDAEQRDYIAKKTAAWVAAGRPSL